MMVAAQLSRLAARVVIRGDSRANRTAADPKKTVDGDVPMRLKQKKQKQTNNNIRRALFYASPRGPLDNPNPGISIRRGGDYRCKNIKTLLAVELSF